MEKNHVHSSLGRAGAAVGQVLGAFGRAWRKLAEIDLLYKAIAFAILTPLIGLLFHFLIARTGSAAVADVDIAMFFFTTRAGMLALFLIGGLVIAVSALEQACLMTVGLARDRGVTLRVRDAFAFVASKAFAVLRLTVQLVGRFVLIVAPFAVAIGLDYWLLLRSYDINFYLKDKPPAFLAALSVAGLLVVALTIVLLRKVAAWLLVLPIVVFENVLPIFAFGESARRMHGRRVPALMALAVWGAFAVIAPFIAAAGLRWFGRTMAPLFGGTMAGMMLFIGFVLVVYLLATLAIGIIDSGMFALLVVHFYRDAGLRPEVRLPKPFTGELEIAGSPWKVSWKTQTALVVAAVPVTALLANFLMKATWTDRPVIVIAHRGAAAFAPENTLAAFRRAVDDGADLVELDVQESKDGIVVVAHDKDLMKVARSPLKIWETDLEALRAVDIGSFFDRSFSSERVPTLAEALDVVKGRTRMNIELKDYGHGERLEERVVELVEAAGMQDRIVTMSLSRPMVEKMKRLRPQWTSGLLIAKALGDVTELPVDFIAVESKMATRNFIRKAHAAGKPVYVWTVNDPNRMIRLIGLGVDGLITDRPALAKEVVEKYMAMPPTQRLLMFVTTRLGARDEISEPDDDLRP